MHYFLKLDILIKTLHVSDSSSVQHQEFFTVHTSMLYVIQVCWQNWFRPDFARKLSANLYYIYHCYVYSEKTHDDGQRNCPKYAEFYSKNKFEKSVHLVGFILRIYAMHGHLNFKIDTVHCKMKDR